MNGTFEPMQRLRIIALMLTLGTAGTAAQSASSSASYQLLSGEPGAGGGPVTGGAISAETSTGDTIVGGTSSPTPNQAQGNGGYTGQLYDVTGLSVSASPASVSEGATSQLFAEAELDDDS